MPSMILTENLVKEYKSTRGKGVIRVIDNLNLEVKEGEIFAFIGPNGAGKTTTIKLLLDFIFPTRGRVLLLGKSPKDTSTRQGIGFLPESSYYYRFLNPVELLDMYGRLFRIGKRERHKKIAELLSMVGLEDFGRMPLRNFSKGMLQRLGLAQALINDPALLILDEPTGGLDPIVRREIRDILRRLNQDGKTIFFSSHELSEVEMISHRVGILNRGRLIKVEGLNELVSERGRKESLEDIFIRLIKEDVDKSA